jgi:hypothetical protein
MLPSRILGTLVPSTVLGRLKEASRGKIYGLERDSAARVLHISLSVRSPLCLWAFERDIECLLDLTRLVLDCEMR